MSKTPDYVLEAQFKTMLRKAHLFDWLAERAQYIQFESNDSVEEWWKPQEADAAMNFESLELFDLCNAEIVKDPAFQFLKD